MAFLNHTSCVPNKMQCTEWEEIWKQCTVMNYAKHHSSALLILNNSKHSAWLPDSMVCTRRYESYFILFSLPRTFPFHELPSHYLLQPNTLNLKNVEFNSNNLSSMKPSPSPQLHPQDETSASLLNFSATPCIIPQLQRHCDSQGYLCISHLAILECLAHSYLTHVNTS